MKLYIYLLALALYAGGAVCVLWAQASTLPHTTAKLEPTVNTGPLSKGAYLAKLGDCISCHSAPDKAPYAGGLPINSPFGTIYSTNITPDKDYGIGSYSFEDFERALRKGIAKDGAYLYPAMPYASFALSTDEDIHALYDYFIYEVKPVHIKSPETKLSFPFSQRWGIRFWDMAFVPNHTYVPREDFNAKWNRGAYLVQSLGHCGECHTPRGPAFEMKGSPESASYLNGEILDNWYAANLRGDNASGLGKWSDEDIVAFLKSGHGSGAAAFGNMTQVVENSTQYLDDQDLHAIAYYLKTLGPAGENASVKDKPEVPFEGNEAPGAGIYAVACATCHQPDGKGQLHSIPKLDRNPAVLASNSASLIRILLEGGSTAHTEEGPKVEKMPAFAKLTDNEIAEVLTYIRQSWTNQAQAVTTRDVSAVRINLKKQ